MPFLPWGSFLSLSPQSVSAEGRGSVLIWMGGIQVWVHGWREGQRPTQGNSQQKQRK